MLLEKPENSCKNVLFNLNFLSWLQNGSEMCVKLFYTTLPPSMILSVELYVSWYAKL